MTRPAPKSEIVADLSAKTGLTKAQANTAIDGLVDVFTARLKAGQTVALPGLVKIEAINRPARQVRNVATGAMMDKAADRGVKAKALTAIKAAVNE